MKVKIEDLDIMFEMNDIRVLKWLVSDAGHLLDTFSTGFKTKYGEEVVYVNDFVGLLYKRCFLIIPTSLHCGEFLFSDNKTKYSVYKIPYGTLYRVVNNTKKFDIP